MENPYEYAAMYTGSDGSIHPGGLRLTDRAVRLADLRKDMAVADIGCGTGSTAAYLAARYHINVIGVDPSAALIERGQAMHPTVHFLKSDCAQLPFDDESMDACIAECSLSVMENLEDSLRQIFRVLKAGGMLIVSDIYAKETSRDTNKNSLIATEKKLQTAMETCGFSVVLSEDHTPALKTFVLELAERCGSMEQTAQLFHNSNCGISHVPLSKMGYKLMVCKKNEFGRECTDAKY